MKVATAEEVRMLRAALAEASDDGLAGFLQAYTLGHVAAMLVAQMAPLARMGFFASMRELYAEARDGAGGGS